MWPDGKFGFSKMIPSKCHDHSGWNCKFFRGTAKVIFSSWKSKEKVWVDTQNTSKIMKECMTSTRWEFTRWVQFFSWLSFKIWGCWYELGDFHYGPNAKHPLRKQSLGSCFLKWESVENQLQIESYMSPNYLKSSLVILDESYKIFCG